MAKSRPRATRRKLCALKGSVGKRGRGLSGGWRRNDRKAVHVKQGDLRSGMWTVFMRSMPKSRERIAGVRAAIVAMKRL
jgi:hypothetical protein